MLRYLTIVFVLYIGTAFGQSVTHGPLVGGVTPNSARFVLFTDVLTDVEIEVATDTGFTNATIVSATTRPSQGNSALLDVDSLVDDTRYYYRARIAGAVATDTRTFQTYPCVGKEGVYSFNFGSCMNNTTTNDAVFQEMLGHPARFFLQVGDWGYPDETDNLPNDPDYYTNDYSRIIKSYEQKYDYTNCQEYLKTICVDYVWDDHDYVNNNSSRNTCSYTDFSLNPTLLEIPILPYSRRNIIDAYYQMFPGYEPVDSSEGIFHKFRFGNMEVFMLDNRAARDPTTISIKQVNGDWVFDPPPGHSIIGQIQREWLLDGLRSSTATWKFVITSTAFNKSFRIARDNILNLPNLAGLPLAAAIVDSWSGFPMDQDSMINAVQAANIDGVVMLSGDTHTSAIDNGVAGGLPEIMAGCLSQTNSTLVNTVPLLQFGLVWSEGGQGVSGNNVNDAFGRITANGDNSILLELIDENGTLIADHLIYSCSYLSGLELFNLRKTDARCFGEPSGSFELLAQGGTGPYEYTLDGRNYQSSGTFTNLKAGDYHPAVKDASGCIREICVKVKEPEQLRINKDVVNASCADFSDGTVDITVSGGLSPYTYEWNHGPKTPNVDSLVAGVYAFTATDTNKCTVSEIITVTEPAPLGFGTLFNDIDCRGGKDGGIILSLSGGTRPYQFAWADGPTSLTRSNLGAGVYPFSVVDSQGCTLVDSINLPQPNPITATAQIQGDFTGNGNGSISLKPGGGTAPYSVEWFNGTTGNNIDNLLPGLYPVTITDANGCVWDTSFQVMLSTYIEDLAEVDLLIYPNPVRDELFIELDLPFTTDVQVSLVNILGQEVFSHTEQQFTSGTISADVSLIQPGNYFLILQSNHFQQQVRVSVTR